MRVLAGRAPILLAMIHSTNMRLVALVLAIVLTVVAATPAKAEADPTLILALVGVALAVIVLIAYLVVANIEGGKSAESERVLWMACAAEGCAEIAAPVASAAPALPLPVADASQGL
jgi:hypothetical protein